MPDSSLLQYSFVLGAGLHGLWIFLSTMLLKDVWKSLRRLFWKLAVELPTCRKILGREENALSSQEVAGQRF